MISDNFLLSHTHLDKRTACQVESILLHLMEADVEGLIGAGRHERSADRLNQPAAAIATTFGNSSPGTPA